MVPGKPLELGFPNDAYEHRTLQRTGGRLSAFGSLLRHFVVPKTPAVALSVSPCGTFVWTGRALQAECDDLEMIGLALLYPALERSVCAPGHHGYPRTSDLILRKALKGR